MEVTMRKSESAGGLGQNDSASIASIRQEVARILESDTFRGAESLRNFLRYVVEQAISGRGAEIKEYTVGLEVFGRGEAFDPRNDSIVRTEARKLRSRLGKYYESEGKNDPLQIEIPKGGYVPAFRENASPERISPILSGSSVAHTRRVAALVAVILLVLGSVALLFRYHSIEHSRSVDSPSVAVLRFANLSDDKDDEVFIEGLTGQIVDSLARIRGLRIVARSSSAQYMSGTTDIRKIGKDLRVGTVVEGSVRRSGGRWGVTVELEDTVTGSQFWAANFDRNLNDTLATEQEISGAITHSLGRQLAKQGIVIDSSASGRTKVNLAAYQDYLEGLYFADKNTPENIKTAIEYFERAIAKDPNFARAYTGLASCYSTLLSVTATPPLDVIPKIRMAASRALKLDSTLSEAHLDLALAFMFDFDWKSAQREFSAALDLEPGSVDGHHAYGNYLAKIGRLEEALAQQQICLDLDPISPSPADWVARSLYYLRRYDEALGQFQNALQLSVRFGASRQGLGKTYFEKAMYSEGLRETILARQLMEGDPMTSGQLGYGYAISGRTAEARRLLAELQEPSNGGTVPPLAVAHIYIGLGDKDNAFKWLQRAVDQHNVSLFLIADPLYDPLRSDSRFAKLLERMRLKALS